MRQINNTAHIAFVRRHSTVPEYVYSRRKAYLAARPALTRAYSVLAIAIRRGDLPRAREFSCSDCHAPAVCYDHRDYLKPLDVQPVCYVCNKRRGSGKNMMVTPQRTRK
jgi:hypothetical protein